MKKRNIQIPPFPHDFGRSYRNRKNSIENSPAIVTSKLPSASILNVPPDASSELSEDLKLIKKVKTLMVNAKSPKWKIGRPNVDNRSIKEKIVDLYLEYAQKKEVQKGLFFKCDIVKELVKREKLNYLTLDVFPDKSLMYNIKMQDYDDPYSISSAMNEHECDSINYQEIPRNIFDLLLNCGMAILYDYHIILEIRKFATSNNKIPPLFSFFTLLKPPSTLINLDNKDKAEFERIQKNYESEVRSKRSGPLHWGLTDPTALEFMCFLAAYCHPFASSFQGRKKRTLPEKMKPKKKTKSEDFTSSKKNPPMSVTCVEETVDVFPLKLDLLKTVLHSSLAKREIILKECDFKNEFSRNLVEIFYFEVDDTKGRKKKINQVQVFTDRTGVFYTYSKDQDYIPCPYKGIPLNRVGSRQNLDRYLYQLAKMKSKFFTQHMCVRHDIVATSKIKEEFFSCESIFPEDMDLSTLREEYEKKKKRSDSILVIHLILVI